MQQYMLAKNEKAVMSGVGIALSAVDKWMVERCSVQSQSSGEGEVGFLPSARLGLGTLQYAVSTARW